MNCLHCEKKISWLKKPVDDVYCSAECRDVAFEEMLERRREENARLEATIEAEAAAERSRERERLEYEAARLRGISEVVRRPVIGESPCPKCDAPWGYVPGGGALGRHLGECSRCGFRAEFVAIENCPNCRCHSLIVESQDDARCPKCKSRPRRRRQIA
jgi:hypothetical protein